LSLIHQELRVCESPNHDPRQLNNQLHSRCGRMTRRHSSHYFPTGARKWLSGPIQLMILFCCYRILTIPVGDAPSTEKMCRYSSPIFFFEGYIFRLATTRLSSPMNRKVLFGDCVSVGWRRLE